MTKNASNADKRTVTVLSQDGEPAGFTYPRRAAGLVKKGRARFVNDNTIRLNSVSDALNTEDIKMDNNIISNTQFSIVSLNLNSDFSISTGKPFSCFIESWLNNLHLKIL